jgi:hypothetical protein
MSSSDVEEGPPSDSDVTISDDNVCMPAMKRWKLHTPQKAGTEGDARIAGVQGLFRSCRSSSTDARHLESTMSKAEYALCERPRAVDGAPHILLADQGCVGAEGGTGRGRRGCRGQPRSAAAMARSARPNGQPVFPLCDEGQYQAGEMMGTQAPFGSSSDSWYQALVLVARGSGRGGRRGRSTCCGDARAGRTGRARARANGTEDPLAQRISPGTWKKDGHHYANEPLDFTSLDPGCTHPYG